MAKKKTVKKKALKVGGTVKMTVAEAVEKANKSWVKKGGKLTKYYCGYHAGLVETRQPSHEDVTSKGFWDSAKICPVCESSSFVTVFPNGKTHSVGMTIGEKTGLLTPKPDTIHVYNPGHKEIQLL